MCNQINKWVSVEDELPEDMQNVIAYKFTTLDDIPVFSQLNCVPTIFINNNFQCSLSNITHWMGNPGINDSKIMI